MNWSKIYNQLPLAMYTDSPDGDAGLIMAQNPYEFTASLNNLLDNALSISGNTHRTFSINYQDGNALIGSHSIFFPRLQKFWIIANLQNGKPSLEISVEKLNENKFPAYDPETKTGIQPVIPINGGEIDTYTIWDQGVKTGRIIWAILSVEALWPASEQ